jgi:hypothetical protein
MPFPGHDHRVKLPCAVTRRCTLFTFIRPPKPITASANTETNAVSCGAPEASGLICVCCCCAGAAERSSAEGVGCLFLAHRGAGAYVAPLSGQSAGSKISTGQAQLTRIHVQDASDMQHARFMESFESRHSDHSFTAAVVSNTGLASFVNAGWHTYLLTPPCNG